MTSRISNSRTRALSWGCALIVLLFTFSLARLTLNRLPLSTLLVVAGFKYASMFYVAGRLIEQTWCYVSTLATRFLSDTGHVSHSPSAELEPDLSLNSRPLNIQRQSRQPHKLRNQMRQLRQAHVVNGKDSEVSHG